MKHQIFSLKV